MSNDERKVLMTLSSRCFSLPSFRTITNSFYMYHTSGRSSRLKRICNEMSGYRCHYEYENRELNWLWTQPDPPKFSKTPYIHWKRINIGQSMTCNRTTEACWINLMPLLFYAQFNAITVYQVVLRSFRFWFLQFVFEFLIFIKTSQ